MFKFKLNSYITHFCIWFVFCLTIFFHKDISNLLQANSIAMLKHNPIKNMVYPFSQSVNWAEAMSSSDLHFSEINDSLKIPPIKYVPELLGSIENLNKLSEQQINARLTYSVPYLGNYKYDGKENVGSHPGVDIKMPVGTPILAIANGIVTKSKESNIGFGNHIVIKHNNVFNYDLNEHETIYSSYAHLDTVYVKAGDVVNVGDIIGLSGNTGLSSGAHLNFQIEKSSAPYHPYWPFSDTEIYAAGLNFVSGINTGYGFNDALKHTYNPLVYIDSLFLDEYIASTESVKPNNGLVAKVSNIVEELEFSLTPKMPEEINPPSPIKQSQIVSEVSELASLSFDINESNNLVDVYKKPQQIKWEIPPIVKPGKTYEFQIYLDDLDPALQDYNIKVNKSASVELISVDKNVLNFELLTNTISTIVLDLYQNNNLVSSVNIESITIAGVDSNDDDFEYVKLLSMMGIIDYNFDISNDSVTYLEALELLTRVYKFNSIAPSGIINDYKIDNSDLIRSSVIATAFGYSLIDNNDILILDSKINLGELMAKHYESQNLYVTPLPKLEFKPYINRFKENKLYVQQAMIDGLIDKEFISPDSITAKQLLSILYNLIM